MTLAPVPAPPREFGWLKGQTHAHSGNSGDSHTPPTEVVRFYAEHGYDFMVFTDHNRVTRVPPTGSLLVIPGAELTQNLDECDPPAPDVPGCNLHMNALFVDEKAPLQVTWPVPPGPGRLKVYQSELDLARGFGALAQLNHPNFRWGADGPLVTELARRGVGFIEIYNGSGDCDDAGDAQHPSTEALWDRALTAGQRVFGMATDGAHHYYDADARRSQGEPVYPGDRGWIRVRAARDPAAIRAALLAGDFYASSGVELAALRVTPEALELEVAASASVPAATAYQTVFIGPGGRELARTRGRSARISLVGQAGYVRAVVEDGAGHRAWVQPVWPAPGAAKDGGTKR